MNSKIFFTALLPIAMVACSKKENLDILPPTNLGGEIIQRTEIDQWLLDSLTIPYNIEVKYRWEPWELNLNRTLTPPQEDKIIPAMRAIKRVWIDPYNEETGSDLFIKKYSAKQFKLVGSVEYNSNGTVSLGQAEGGNNITFFDINQNFFGDPVAAIKEMIHTAHHEFAHILHQNVMYPQEFKGISARKGLAGYTGTWFNVDHATAYANGYITPYSMSGYDDDFADMVSIMLAEGKNNFDQIVNAQNSTAQEALREKEQYVVSYFREAWNIDFYSLQSRVQSALAGAIEVRDLFDFDRSYSIASITVSDPAFLPHATSFRQMYVDAADALAAMPENYQLDSVQVFLQDEQTMVLAFYITDADGQDLALFGYDYVKSGEGNHYYSFFGANALGAQVQSALLDMLIYFNDREFGLSWFANPVTDPFPRVKFAPVDEAGNYFIGRLIPN